MTVGDRIKKRRIELGYSVDYVADCLNKNRATIYRYESNDIENMSINVILPLSIVLKTTPCFLMGWDDENKNNEINSVKFIPETKPIPIVGTVACGNPIYAEENILEYIPVLKTDNVDFALYAKGDSMNNRKIDDGDIIYVRIQPIVNNGEIAIVLINDEATVKRFYDYGDKVVLRPDSTNTEHKEQVYNKKDHNIIIQGKVVFIKTFIN